MPMPPIGKNMEVRGPAGLGVMIGDSVVWNEEAGQFEKAALHLTGVKLMADTRVVQSVKVGNTTYFEGAVMPDQKQIAKQQGLVCRWMGPSEGSHE